MSKLKNSHLISDMRPYTEILKNIAKYFKSGEDITIFEIGIRRGVSTRAFLEGALERIEGTKADVHGCDIDDRSNAIRDDKLKSIWTFYHSNSMDLKWDKEIDILMIDGEHTYDAVKKDYLKYEPFVKSGGLIILHDVGVYAAQASLFWKEIKHPKIILDLNKQGLGIITKI